MQHPSEDPTQIVSPKADLDAPKRLWDNFYAICCRVNNVRGKEEVSAELRGQLEEAFVAYFVTTKREERNYENVWYLLETAGNLSHEMATMVLAGVVHRLADRVIAAESAGGAPGGTGKVEGVVRETRKKRSSWW